MASHSALFMVMEVADAIARTSQSHVCACGQQSEISVPITKKINRKLHFPWVKFNCTVMRCMKLKLSVPYLIFFYDFSLVMKKYSWSQ